MGDWVSAKSPTILKEFNPGATPLFTPDLSYLGALIDGEGCITVVRSCATGSRYYLHISITQKYLAVILKQIQDQFGGGLYESDRGYRWTIVGNPAVNLLIDVYPFLIGKMYQAQLAISAHGERIGDPAADRTVQSLKDLKRRVLL